MILILFLWLYLCYIQITLGFYFNKITQLELKNSLTIALLGFVPVTLLASICAIFFRINFEFQIFLLTLSIIIHFKFKIEIHLIFKKIYHQIKDFPLVLKIFLFCLTIIIALKSAKYPIYTDNETYYIQTIKWLNEYGFVKGLANLNILLGQNSGWHILQSAFSFSYFNQNFNDLNGLCLILVNIFSLTKLNSYWEKSNKTNKKWLFIGFLPASNVLLIPFISAPSPDLGVIIFSILIFYYFLKNFDCLDFRDFNLIFMLTVFVVYIKITALPLLSIPLLLLLLNFKKLYNKIVVSYLLGALFLLLFIIKNLILTGFPLFPSSFLANVFSFHFQLPIEMYNFSFNEARLYRFVVTKSDFAEINGFQLITKWLLYSKLDSVFNTIIFLNVLLIPIFIKKYFNTKPFWILYFVMLSQLIFMLCSSPQYRFILNFMLFFSILLFSYYLNNRKIILISLSINIIILTVITFVDFEKLVTTNKIETSDNKQSFSFENLVIPIKNTNLNTKYTICKIDNLEYYTPDRKTFFWATGDGNLPCVNQKQILFFMKKYGYVPQMESDQLKDGFYSKKIAKK